MVVGSEGGPGPSLFDTERVTIMSGVEEQREELIFTKQLLPTQELGFNRVKVPEWEKL